MIDLARPPHENQPALRETLDRRKPIEVFNDLLENSLSP